MKSKCSFDEWMSCRRKNAYKTRHSAQQVIDSSQRFEGKELRYYTCDYCGFYHITKKELAKS